MKQQHAIQLLMVTALGVCNLVVLAWLNSTGEGWPTHPAVVGMGLALGQVCLASAYVALGRLNIALRILAFLLVTAQSGYLATACTGGPGESATWFSMLLLLCALAILPLALVRMAGGRVVHVGDPSTPTLARWQFSIWGTLSLMTGMAFLFAALRWAALPEGSYGAMLAFSLMMAVSLWACAFSVLSSRLLPVGIIPPAIIICLTGFVLPYSGLPPANDVWQLWQMNLVHGGLLLGAFSAVHLAGYRLEVWPAARGKELSAEEGIKFLP